MEVSRMKMVDEVARALGASMLTILLMVAMTATMTTASDYYKVYEYTTTVYRLAWVNGRFTIYSDSGSFQLYSWDFTDKHREIENNKPYYNTTVLRHVTIHYYRLSPTSGECVPYRKEEVKEKVDWPVNVIFAGETITKARVAEVLRSVLPAPPWYCSPILPLPQCISYHANPMYMYLKNYNTSWKWDEATGAWGSDSGAKSYYESVVNLIGWTYDCTGASGSYVHLHIRLYAPTQKEETTPEGVVIEHEFFSDGNLRYVIATAHFDREELSGGGSGWSECAEKLIEDAFRGKGYGVYRDYIYGYNWIHYVRVYDGMYVRVAIGLHAVEIHRSSDEYCTYVNKVKDIGLYHVYLNNGYITYIRLRG
jgi:hypothetical protein